MELLPAAAPEPADPAPGRGGGQGNQEKKRSEAHQNPRMLDHVNGDVVEGGRLVEHGIGQEVGQREPEGRESEEPPDADQLVPAAETTEGGDREGEKQRHQHRRASNVLDEFHLVAGDPAGAEGEPDPDEREDRREVECRLECPGDQRGARHPAVRSSGAGPSLRRVMQPGRRSR